jgi:hypothetical protein
MNPNLLLGGFTQNTYVNYQDEERNEEKRNEKAYIEAYNTVPQTILTGGNVFFPIVSIVENVDTNTATGEFTIKADGVYSISLGIIAAAATTPSIPQFGIYVNSILRPSTTFAGIEGALLELKTGDILTIKNSSQGGTVTTSPSAGTNPSVAAKIVIFKI